MKKIFGLLIMLGILFLGNFSCSSNSSPSSANNNGGSNTATPTPVPSGPSLTPTVSNTTTATSTVTPTLTPGLTATFTNTPTSTSTNSVTNTATATATSTQTFTATPTCAGANGSLTSSPDTHGAWGSVNVIDCRPITVTGLIKITDFDLQGENGASSSVTEYIGIYASNGSSPTTLIATASSVVAAGATNPTISFSSPVPLTSGIYWLAADSNDYSGSMGFELYLYTPQDGGYDYGTGGAMPTNLTIGSLTYGPCITADWVCP